MSVSIPVSLVELRLLRATGIKNEQAFETGRRERDAEARMPNRPVAVASLQMTVKQRAAQREAGGWARAGRRHSSQERKGRITWQGQL